MVVIGKTNEKSTPGEKKLFNHFEKFDDSYSHYYFCYQPKIIDRYPDFIIIGKEIGVVIIEVKDYTDEIDVVKTSGSWISSKDGRDLRNPFDQIKNYIDEVSIATANSQSIKNIQKFIQCVVVFPEIAIDSPIWNKIDKEMPSNVISFFKNHIHSTHAKFYNEFKNRVSFDFSLNPIEIKNLQAKLVPLSVIPSPKQTRFGQFLSDETDIKLLDSAQEQFARELGEGHRIIYGVAGSGKTVMLIARAKYLSIKHPDWRILLLCYNKLLRDFIAKTLQSPEYTNIMISTYHSFAYKTIVNDPKLKSEYFKLNNEYKNKKTEFFQEIVPKLLIRAISDDYNKFDAVLIDEGQDFAKSWFDSVIKLLDPVKKSLLITLDGLQSIFAQKKFRWIDAGIEARGKTVYLEKSYRNPKTIGEFAREFLLKDEAIRNGIIKDEELVPTKEFLRSGGEVVYIDKKGVWDNRKEILGLVKNYYEKNLTILILFRYDYSDDYYTGNKDKLLVLLAERNIKFKYMKDEWNLDRPGINVNTIHGVKGLESDVVIIPDINEYQNNSTNRKLCYMAMTRAIKHLVVTATGDSDWTKEIKEILNK